MKSCSTIRRKLITYSTFNMVTGKKNPGRQEWVTEPCGKPLFWNDEKEGICRACASGWEVEGNRPATPDEMADYNKSVTKPSK